MRRERDYRLFIYQQKEILIHMVIGISIHQPLDNVYDQFTDMLHCGVRAR